MCYKLLLKYKLMILLVKLQKVCADDHYFLKEIYHVAFHSQYAHDIAPFYVLILQMKFSHGTDGPMNTATDVYAKGPEFFFGGFHHKFLQGFPNEFYQGSF